MSEKPTTTELRQGEAPAESPGAPEPSSSGDRAGPETRPLEFLSDVELRAGVELGRTVLTVGEVLRLAPGSVVTLDRLLGDPVDLLVNDRLVARGEVVVVDGKFGLRVTEIVSGGETW